MLQSPVGPPTVCGPGTMAPHFVILTLHPSLHTPQKPEGREHLRRLLNWEEFDELRDSRRSILLDTLYESIIFAVGKGFPWVEVAKVVKFTEELLKETKGTRHPGLESARLRVGTQSQKPSEEPGAPFLLPLAFTFFICSCNRGPIQPSWKVGQTECPC